MMRLFVLYAVLVVSVSGCAGESDFSPSSAVASQVPLTATIKSVELDLPSHTKLEPGQFVTASATFEVSGPPMEVVTAYVFLTGDLSTPEAWRSKYTASYGAVYQIGTSVSAKFGAGTGGERWVVRQVTGVIMRGLNPWPGRGPIPQKGDPNVLDIKVEEHEIVF